MASEIFTYLSSSIPVELSESPLDYYDPFTLQAMTRTTGSVQPPGPGVQMYAMDWEMTDQGLIYNVRVQWEPWVKDWLLKVLPKSQITHRSRLLAIAANELKINELNHRLQQTQEMYTPLKQAAITPAQSKALVDIVIDKTRKYMHLNPEWIREYINAHKQSSLGGGYNWRMAYEITRSEWEQLQNQLKDNLENIATHDTYYSRIPWYSGIRARSEELPGYSDHYGPLTMTRSRIILFHPSMSLWTIFISQKAAWYQEVLEEAMKELHVVGEYHFPYVMGGQIYILAQQLFNTGLPFHANDGKSWESSQGILLGPSFRPFMVNFKGIPMLPSGETFTSMFGTLASIVATRKIPGTWLVLGDDMNSWGAPHISKPFIEYQEGDSLYKWILGVRYDIDVNRPRISGLKMSMDRARAMKPLDALPYIKHDRVMYRRRDPRTRVAWAGLFQGWFGDKSLIDSLASTPPGEYISPGELIERMVEEKVGEVDPYAWAESLGIKELFIT